MRMAHGPSMPVPWTDFRVRIMYRIALWDEHTRKPFNALVPHRISGIGILSDCFDTLSVDVNNAYQDIIRYRLYNSGFWWLDGKQGRVTNDVLARLVMNLSFGDQEIDGVTCLDALRLVNGLLSFVHRQPDGIWHVEYWNRTETELKMK